jgi:hypothetical protein
MKKIKLRLIPFKKEQGKLHLRPMEDEFIVDCPTEYITGALTIEIDPKHLKIEETWDEAHES